MTTTTTFIMYYNGWRRRERYEPLTDPLPSVRGPWKPISSVSLADLRFHDRPIGDGVLYPHR